MSKKITDWKIIDDDTTFDNLYDLVEHAVNCNMCDKDYKLEIIGYCKKAFDIDSNANWILSRLIESLDEDTGAGCYTEPSKKMGDASKVFVKAVLEEYPRYQLEMVKSKTIKIADYIKENK